MRDANPPLWQALVVILLATAAGLLVESLVGSAGIGFAAAAAYFGARTIK
jgi:hypothetical protein